MPQENVARPLEGQDSAPVTQRSPESPIMGKIREAGSDRKAVVEVVDFVSRQGENDVTNFGKQVGSDEQEIHPEIQEWIDQGKEAISAERKKFIGEMASAETVGNTEAETVPLGVSESSPNEDQAVKTEKFSIPETMNAEPKEVSESSAEEIPATQPSVNESGVRAKKEEPQAPAERMSFDETKNLFQGMIDEFSLLSPEGKKNPPKVLVSKLRKIMATMHPDRSGNGPQEAELYLFASRLKMAMDGDSRAWLNPRGVDLKAEWNSWKNPKKEEKAGASGEAVPPTAREGQVPPTQPGEEPIPRTEGMPETKSKDEENGPATEPGIPDDAWHQKLEDQIRGSYVGQRKEDIHQSVAHFEKSTKTRVAFREKKLQEYYAMPSSERTPYIDACIDELNYENQIDTETLSRHQQELESWELQNELKEIDEKLKGKGDTPGMELYDAGNADLSARREAIMKRIGDLQKGIAGSIATIGSLKTLLDRTKKMKTDLEKQTKETDQEEEDQIKAVQSEAEAPPKKVLSGGVGGAQGKEHIKEFFDGKTVQGLFAAMHGVSPFKSGGGGGDPKKGHH